MSANYSWFFLKITESLEYIKYGSMHNTAKVVNGENVLKQILKNK